MSRRTGTAEVMTQIFSIHLHRRRCRRRRSRNFNATFVEFTIQGALGTEFYFS